MIDGEHQLAIRQGHLHRARTLSRHRRDAVDSGFEGLVVDGQLPVISFRDDAAIIGEGAVDQFRSQDGAACTHDDLRVGDFDLDVLIHPVDEAARFCDRLAGHDDAFEIFRAGGGREFCEGEAVAVRSHRPQHGLTVLSLGSVKVNAVQIVAGFLGRDREPCLVDQTGEILRAEREFGRRVVRAHGLEVGGWQGRQLEMRAACRDGETLAFRLDFQFDFGASGQLAHNVEQRTGRSRHRAFARDGRIGAVDRLNVEVGCREFQLAIACLKQDIGEDRDRVPALHHILHV